MSEPSDGTLLEAWADGDRDAGSRLFERHFTSVRRFFSNKVGNDVEDLLQQTFMTCVESLERFRRASSFRTFLFGVARNVLLEHFRERLKLSSDAELGETCAVALGEGPSTLMSMAQDRRLLLEALRRLPLETQVLLELAYWQKLNSEEIGEVLGINRNTARSRLIRSRTLLEKALEVATRDETALRTTMANLDSWAAGLRTQMQSGTS